MKTIIAGSRDITDPAILDSALIAWGWGSEITAVVCGEASGADELGRKWAEAHAIPILSYPADWKTHGKAAGPLRNAQMVEVADALLALWDGKSAGTANIIKLARAKQAKLNAVGERFLVYVYTLDNYRRYQYAVNWHRTCKALTHRRDWPAYEVTP